MFDRLGAEERGIEYLLLWVIHKALHVEVQAGEMRRYLEIWYLWSLGGVQCMRANRVRWSDRHALSTTQIQPVWRWEATSFHLNTFYDILNREDGEFCSSGVWDDEEKGAHFTEVWRWVYSTTLLPYPKYNQLSTSKGAVAIVNENVENTEMGKGLFGGKFSSTGSLRFRQRSYI